MFARTMVGLSMVSVAALMLAGCNNHGKVAGTPGCPDGDEATAMAGRKVASGEMGSSKLVQCANMYCPIAGSHKVGDKKMQSEDLTRQWQGKTIGFCCDSCPPVWDGMSEADKTRAFEAVMALGR